MGVKEKKRKFNPRPKINYPPVPTRKWIPPDKRPKKKKPPPKYIKPPGMNQKLAISALRKIWHHFMFFGETAILTGNFAETHKKFSYTSRGLQTACNCALACVFAHIRGMDTWSKGLMDYILDLGNDLFYTSLQQDPDRCWTTISTARVYTSVYIGTMKVSFEIDAKRKVEESLSVVNEEKLKEALEKVVNKFFDDVYFCGILTFECKNLALWIKDGKYYLFDPTAHTSCGVFWTAGPGGACGKVTGGLSVCYRCSTMEDLILRIFDNIDNSICKVTFWIEPCLVLRVTNIDICPPDNYEDIHPIRWQQVPTEEEIMEKYEKSEDVMLVRLQQFVEETDRYADPKLIEIQELAPEVDKTLSVTKRPSWLQSDFEKMDVCKFPIPYKKMPDMTSFYLEIVPGEISIMRAGTHQCDSNFTKYMGRQSMGNAISVLTMLRFYKSKYWVPALLNKVLKYGDLLYRDAMISIPRTQALKLSNFSKKTEYWSRYFLPIIDDYVTVGRLSSKEFEVLDLFAALESFLVDNESCVLIGPITLSIWVEDGKFYMFDPNERDEFGKVVVELDEPPMNLSPCNVTETGGKACLMWFTDLHDLVNLYMENVEKPDRSDIFYLSTVKILDYVEIPDVWYNFKGFAPGKWILRGTISQNDRKFEEKSKNYQSPAVALVALAMNKLKSITEWQEDTIDEMIDLGDQLYKETIQTLTEKGEFNNRMLMLNDINKKYIFWEKLCEFTIEECTKNGIFTAKNFMDVTNLYKGMREYFMMFESGIVTCRNISVAVWRFDEMYFYCDSHYRDDKGLCNPYGQACIVRSVTLEDIAEMMMANFAPNPEDYFNINHVLLAFFEVDDEGFIKPIINYYKKLTDYIYILRSLYSEISNRYDPHNCGKQTIPMCLMALAYNKLKPSVEWNQSDIDEIINKGDTLYTESILDILRREETEFIKTTMHHEVAPLIEKTDDKPGTAGSEGSSAATKDATKSDQSGSGGTEQVVGDAATTPAPGEEIVIDLNNVRQQYNIGLNKFTFRTEDIASGIIHEGLQDSIKNYFDDVRAGKGDEGGGELISKDTTSGTPTEGTPSGDTKSGSQSADVQGNPNEDLTNKEVMVVTKPYTVALWKDSKCYYLFDPKPRDKEGNVIGKQLWSEIAIPKKPPPKKEKTPALETIPEEPKATEETTAPAEGETAAQGDDAIEKVTNYDTFVEGEGEKRLRIEDMTEYGQVEGEAEAICEEELLYGPTKEENSDGYWAEMAKAGRGCVIAFSKLDELVEHIYSNIPPRDTLEENFTLKSIKLINAPECKDILRPQDIRNDVFEGNWYDFVEFDRGMWILRGTLHLCHELFPPWNRCKQQCMTAIVALAVSYIFGMMCFNEYTVDSILKYGDRLLTFAKRVRKMQMKEYNPDKLCDEELDWLLAHEDFCMDDIPKKMCISKFMVHVEGKQEVVCGDIKAQEFEEILDVRRGLDKFFEKYTYGVLQAKDLSVAIWKGVRMYYMFDGMNRGPNGKVAPCGTACITRWLTLDGLVDTFLTNLGKLGKNNFYIHALCFKKDICPRVRQPKIVLPPPMGWLGAFKEVIPGKWIVRGSITQDDPKFGKEPNSMGVPIAFVALAMTLIHRSITWTKPIVDDIIELGSILWDQSVQKQGFDFNPWEEKLDVCKCNRDFTIGILKCNVQLRTMDQRGQIEAKDPCILTLRKAIDKFFEENTHGIIWSDPITLGIWEEALEENNPRDPLIYVYDPNPRGPTGMPVYDGTACVLAFINPKMAGDHICSCILDPDKKGSDFRLIPVEIVVGCRRTCRKTIKKPDCKSFVSILSRCTDANLNEEKRLMRKLAECERKQKEARRLALIGRKNYYILKNGDGVIRGFKSQNSECYGENVRNNQDIPMCIVALVMHTLFSIDSWTHKNIDLVLDTGNQLYIDSYIAYGPKDLKLGPENIIRKFFLRHLTIKVIVYKPIISDEFLCNVVDRVLQIYFSQEPFCMLSYQNNWVAIVAKAGFFYMFDPHERDIEGNPVKEGETGTAVVLRFDTVERLAEKLLSNFYNVDVQENVCKCDSESYKEDNLFTLWLIAVEVK